MMKFLPGNRIAEEISFNDKFYKNQTNLNIQSYIIKIF